MILSWKDIIPVGRKRAIDWCLCPCTTWKTFCSLTSTSSSPKSAPLWPSISLSLLLPPLLLTARPLLLRPSLLLIWLFLAPPLAPPAAALSFHHLPFFPSLSSPSRSVFYIFIHFFFISSWFAKKQREGREITCCYNILWELGCHFIVIIMWLLLLLIGKEGVK